MGLLFKTIVLMVVVDNDDDDDDGGFAGAVGDCEDFLDVPVNSELIFDF